VLLDGHKVDALGAGQREALRELVGRSLRRMSLLRKGPCGCSAAGGALCGDA
jgi:hypothetical protein